MDVSPTNHQQKATALRVSECGEEAGVCDLDPTDSNHVMRHHVPGKLAFGSNAQNGLKQHDVNMAGIRRKLSYLIWGDLVEQLITRSQQKP